MRILWLSLAALCVLTAPVAGHDDDGVKTNRQGAKRLPLPKQDGVWHFIVYGDRTGGPRSGLRILEQAVADTNLLDPDLVMTVGDLVEGYNDTPEWLVQTREFQAIMDRLRMRWYPVAGNHDIYWRGKGAKPPGEHESNYERHFGPLWYWFRHKNAAFVVLYTDEGDPETNTRSLSNPKHTQMSKAQIAWLRDTLTETADAEHVFVFLHHPRWIERRYRGSNWAEVHAVLAAARNVTAVFAGHIHRMHHGGVRDGIEYITLGTTGGSISQVVPRAGFLHHFNVVTVRSSGIRVAVLPVGEVIDPKTMTQELHDDVDRVLRGLPPTFSGRIELAADGSASGEVTVSLHNPSGRPVETELRFDDGNGGWRFQPDHIHRTLAPGARESLPIRCIRAADEWRAFAGPEVAVRADYLAEGFRIELVERSAPLPIVLTVLPEGFWRSPMIDGAVHLPGSGDCVRVESRVASLPAGPFTVEGWFRPTHLNGRRPLIAKTETSEYGLFASDGVPYFTVHLSGKYVTARAPQALVEPGRWTHVAGVFDGSEVRLYVDGRLAARAAGEGKRTRNPVPLYIGADPNRRGAPVDTFPGAIDEVRLSVVARYDGESFEPARRFEPDSKTALLLHCDHVVGPFVVDHSPGAAHARRIRGAHVVPRSGTMDD